MAMASKASCSTVSSLRLMAIRGLRGGGEFFEDCTKVFFNKESMSSEERAALHIAKMKDFPGSRDDFFNPIFELWAESMQHPRTVFDSDGTCRDMHRSIGMQHYSYAIPTLSVLRYMVSKAPDGKIAEIGSGIGYWASLLMQLGANVVAVDDFSTQPQVKPMVETVKMDGAEFIKQGGADGRALFLCWPRMKDGPDDSFCLGEACLDLYKGNTVFFVGEKGGCTGCTYDVEDWMETHREVGWRLEVEMAVPCWAGLRDCFMCFVKHEES